MKLFEKFGKKSENSENKQENKKNEKWTRMYKQALRAIGAVAMALALHMSNADFAHGGGAETGVVSGFKNAPTEEQAQQMEDLASQGDIELYGVGADGKTRRYNGVDIGSGHKAEINNGTHVGSGHKLENADANIKDTGNKVRPLSGSYTIKNGPKTLTNK